MYQKVTLLYGTHSSYYKVKILLQGFEIYSCKVDHFVAKKLSWKVSRKIHEKLIPKKTPLFKKNVLKSFVKNSWKVTWK